MVTKNRNLPLWSSALLIVALTVGAASSFAADPAPGNGKIDLKKVKQDQGPQVQVVQNRLFSKEGRLELSLFGGTVMTDPFLSVYNVGGALGYNFNEFISFHLLGWKDLASVSSSETTFEQKTQNATNYNKPKSLYAAEVHWSPIYGKLNLLNSSILYYDFHIGPGFGLRSTESGSSLAYILNIGQNLFLSKHVMLEFDYRLLMFKQKIVERVLQSSLGQEIADPFEISNVFTFGVGFLF